jgi:hypothetical protein
VVGEPFYETGIAIGAAVLTANIRVNSIIKNL